MNEAVIDGTAINSATNLFTQSSVANVGFVSMMGFWVGGAGGIVGIPPTIYLTGNTQRNVDMAGAVQRNAVLSGNVQRNVGLTSDAGSDA